MAYGTFEDRLRPIGGLNIFFRERLSSTILFDGVRVHPLFNYTVGDTSSAPFSSAGAIPESTTAFRFDT